MSNITLSTSDDISINKTDLATASFVYAMVSCVVVGTMGMFGSLLVMVAIFKSKPLRTPCFQLIAGGAFGSSLVAAHYFGRGIDKVGMLTGGMLSINRSVLVCLMTTGLEGLFGIPYHAMVTCLVGVDRTISLLAPIKYRSLGNRYVIYMLSTVAVLVLAEEIIGIATAPLNTVIVCTSFPEALHPVFIGTFAALNLFYCTAIVLVYTTMLICFYNKKKTHKEGSSEHSTFMKQQSAAMPTVKMMTFLYFITGIVPEIMINVALKFDRVANLWVDIFMVMGDFLKCSSSLVEVISLMICSKKFRQSTKILLGLKTNNVATILVSSQSGRSANVGA